MQVINNHYVFEHPNPGHIKTYIPDVKEALVQGRQFVAVPHKLEAAQVLNRMGLDVPSPIEDSYKWSGAFTPFAHQKKTASFLTLNRRSYLLSGLGSGKSLASLWAADFLMKHGYVKRCLIISPLSTLDVVWAKELFIHFPHRSFNVLHGSREKRKELLAQEKDFYIINHHGPRILEKELLARQDIDLIIIDELSVFRNAKAQTMWKPVKALVNRNVWVWGLTGSPTPNAPTDAYGQIKLITPERYTGTFTRFKQDTMFQVSQFRWVPRQKSEDMIHKLMQPAIRYALQDCIDLPETIYSHRHAELSKEQAHHYKELTQQAVTEVNGSVVTAVNAAVLITKLVQVVLGSVYGADGDVNEIDFGPRLSVIEECIDECNEKVILFVPLTGALNAMYQKLKKNYTCEIVDGSTSSGKRREIFNAFQNDPNPRVLIANPQAIAHGVTLTAASTIIWAAPIWNNEIFQQANARIVRPGQKNITNIIQISATPVEQKIYTALDAKGRLQDLVLELFKR